MATGTYKDGGNILVVVVVVVYGFVSSFCGLPLLGTLLSSFDVMS